MKATECIQSPSHHIGLIGCGAVGMKVIEVLSRQQGYKLTLLKGRTTPDLPSVVTVVSSLEQLLACNPELVLEMTTTEAFPSLVTPLLAAGIDVIAASIGALADPQLLIDLARIAASSGARLILPAGAVGGLDYLIATRSLDDVSILYTSRKPPAAWRTELLAMGRVPELDEAVVLFEGTASLAAQRYPRNLNAGLTIALAGGLDRTRVRVIADPTVVHNTHEIEVTSSAGTAYLSFENHPSTSNPKTSALTGLSLAAMVHRCLDPVSI